MQVAALERRSADLQAARDAQDQHLADAQQRIAEMGRQLEDVGQGTREGSTALEAALRAAQEETRQQKARVQELQAELRAAERKLARTLARLDS